ncbi:MAG: DUF4202 domain-containing protein, partial [Pseudomonadota bacterium]
MDKVRFDTAIARFDDTNAQDPNQENGQPKELLYGRRMSGWLDKLTSDAPEALKLAARCQHIRRWAIPRSEYPMGRQGYHRWRNRLKQYHAEVAGEILQDVGYDDELISRVQSLLRKENLTRDPEMQLLEDVICLVFLENYLADFSTQHEESKIIDILRKTLGKMSASEKLRL